MDEKHSSDFKKNGNGKHGGARPGAGRPPGRKDGHTLEIEAAAREFAGDALKALTFIATQGESESARVAAACALLDRGYGRAKQQIELTGDALANLPDEELAEIVGRPALKIA